MTVRLPPKVARDPAKNRRTMMSLMMIVAGMSGLAAASPPLYRIFCQVTGFGGATMRAEALPDQISDRVINVRFDANVADIPWAFQPEIRSVAVRVGENGLISYRATNKSPVAMTGTATFNVTPEIAGAYFSKIACFCFTDQRLEPGESIDMPVSFFVDPAILKDRNLDGVNTITLSYTFFRSKTPDVRPLAAAGPAESDGKARP
ncbi:MAG: cytochrome c oxidase assembly protein [Elsteraceae bacterium]